MGKALLIFLMLKGITFAIRAIEIYSKVIRQ